MSAARERESERDRDPQMKGYTDRDLEIEKRDTERDKER